MRYQFTKMQSLGNDFIVFDGVSDKLMLSAEIAAKVAERHFGVGCDQVLWVQTDPDGSSEFLLTIYNQDGSEAEQCGNGARCIARFLYVAGLSKNKVMRVRTNKVAMTLTINSDESVSVDMGMPEFDPKKIPFLAEQTAPTYTLELPSEKTPQEQVEVSVLSMGNPHAVQRVADITNAPLARQGALIENHERFPQRVNAGFMQVISREHIRLRVHERGVGETLGCGSGACAAG